MATMPTKRGAQEDPGAQPRHFRGVGAFATPLLLVLALFALAGSSLAAQEAHARRQVAVMGTLASLDVWAGSRGAARAALERAVRALEATEARLSTWRPDTELARLNAAPVGVPQALSGELLDLLADVWAWSERTGRAFEPAVGPLIDAWDLRGEGRVPTDAERADAVEAMGPGAFELDREAATLTRLHPRAWMDAGGWGKGAGLRAVSDSLGAHGIVRARVDLGGQLLVLGGEPVVIGVAHPARRGEVAAKLRFTGLSVATSGQSERGVEVDGRRYGHILDPRSGSPAPAWGSVTVAAADPLVADILATALFVMGPEAAEAFAAELDDIGVLLLDDRGGDLRAVSNPAMDPLILEVPNLRPQFTIHRTSQRKTEEDRHRP